MANLCQTTVSLWKWSLIKNTVNQELRHLLDVEGYIETCLDHLLATPCIPKEDNFPKPWGSRPSIMYGFCEVSKRTGASNDLQPFRLILSAIGTCIYNIAKFFVPILKEFKSNEYALRDSFPFCDEINKITIFIWHPLTLNHFLRTFPWTKQSIFL